jgi:BirA family biotin operon repressor/biotin-[acetyl-CoA-carboxylase] ligase
MGFSFKVKWPNDIIYNEKKICGILTEMSGEMNRVYDVVLGIGVNVNQTLEDFPEDLREKASSIYMEAGLKINRQKLCANILNAFERLYDDFLTEGVGEEAIAICKEHSILIGKRIFITKGDTVFMAHVEDLNEQGELIVKKEDGTFESLISGEVSVRGEKGYLI